MIHHRYALVLTPLAAAAIAYAISPWVTRLAVSIGAIDLPDARKIHHRPTPRLGGLAIIIAVAIVLLGSPFVFGTAWATSPELARGLVLGLLPIVVVSLFDDVRPVAARTKFLCHIAGASLAVALGIALPEHLHVLGFEFWIGPLAAPISVLWLAGITNAFNIIDGLDGLAAGLAFIAAVAVSAVFVTGGQLPAAMLPLALAGAIAGFLPVQPVSRAQLSRRHRRDSRWLCPRRRGAQRGRDDVRWLRGSDAGAHHGIADRRHGRGDRAAAHSPDGAQSRRCLPTRSQSCPSPAVSAGFESSARRTGAVRARSAHCSCGVCVVVRLEPRVGAHAARVDDCRRDRPQAAGL